MEQILVEECLNFMDSKRSKGEAVNFYKMQDYLCGKLSCDENKIISIWVIFLNKFHFI